MKDKDIKERVLLARKLRDLRLAAGLSQQVLGDRIKRAQSYISKVENEQRRVELHEVAEWAQACGKAMYWTFVDLDESGSPETVSAEAIALREGLPSVAPEDTETVASVAWLLPRLSETERSLLVSTINFLMEKTQPR